MSKQVKLGAKGKAAKEVSVSSAPRFPYTTKPASLRRLLKEIPKKPKPVKYDQSLLRSWGFGDTNDLTMIRVLKAVNLLTDKNEPTDLYAKFMHISSGAQVLGEEIRRVYAPIFTASHTPFAEGNDVLLNLFNIHSGGGERTIEHQIQTFKALCENASFDQGDPLAASQQNANQNTSALSGQHDHLSINSSQPIIHIDLHIHLPENKTSRDYENIIEDIGRHIFGRDIGRTRNG